MYQQHVIDKKQSSPIGMSRQQQEAKDVFPLLTLSQAAFCKALKQSLHMTNWYLPVRISWGMLLW